MLFRVFVLCFLFCVQVIHAREFDTVMMRNAVKQHIQKALLKPGEGAYIIAGEQGEHLLFVNNRYKVKDFAKKKRIPVNTKFTDLVNVTDAILLVATQQNGLYFIRNGAAVHINEAYGLTDTNVLALRWDTRLNRVFVKTASACYVSADNGLRRYIRMTESDKIQMLDSGAQNMLDFFKRYIQEPVQHGISSFVSDIDYSFRPVKAIKRRQFRRIRKKLQPGDVLIKRNESQLTNIGIPGFWTHTGLYLGGKRDINRYFAGIPMLQGQKPIVWIKNNYPRVYAQIQKQRTNVIEAVGEGIVVNPLEHIAMVDYFAALRLNRSREDVFKVLLQSFEYYGLPYDYLFDFESDKAMVCSEFVYKSISRTKLLNPALIEQSSLFGKPFVSPSDLAFQYCAQDSVDAVFSLVLFYKANTKFTRAKKKYSDDFCTLKMR